MLFLFAGIETESVEVVNWSVTKEGRHVEMFMNGSVVQALKARGNKVTAGLSQLNFRVDHRADGGEL